MKDKDLTNEFPSLKLDKTVFSVTSRFDDDDEKAYWRSRTPHERLLHMEVLRRINYGDKATERLQKVLEIVESHGLSDSHQNRILF